MSRETGPSNPKLRRRLIRAFLDENVRVPFPPHVVASASGA